MEGNYANTKKFLVVDDHTIIRSALSTILTELYTNVSVDQCLDGTDVLEKMQTNVYDMVIMDIQMPKTDAIGLIKQMHNLFPKTPVLVYSMTLEKMYGVAVLKSGAKGFVCKQSSLEELKNAIIAVMQGKTYLTRQIVDLISEQAFKTTPFSNLSARELQVVELLLAGKGVTEISKALGLKVSTVGTHKNHIYTKLKVTNLLELRSSAESLSPVNV